MSLYDNEHPWVRNLRNKRNETVEYWYDNSKKVTNLVDEIISESGASRWINAQKRFQLLHEKIFNAKSEHDLDSLQKEMKECINILKEELKKYK